MLIGKEEKEGKIITTCVLVLAIVQICFFSSYCALFGRTGLVLPLSRRLA